ncbi:hypothetical protein GA0071314_0805 [Halomonas sp. HL-93]|nr:hypothetical protein GA0071314_0805 [Halomonas sp. HL-93]SNY98825.1 hypothetical protein SAMN04488142_3458 [Halomonas sp. hl-4]
MSVLPERVQTLCRECATIMILVSLLGGGGSSEEKAHEANGYAE